MEAPRSDWLIRRADLVYRLVLVALIGLWVAFPPRASEPGWQISHATAAAERSGERPASP